MELVHWALKKKGGQSVLKRMKVMFLGVNGFLYAFLLVLVIIFIALEASISTTDVRSLPPSMTGKPSLTHPARDSRFSCRRRARRPISWTSPTPTAK